LKAIREDLLQAIRIARQLDNPNAALEIIDRCADLLVKGGKAEQLAPILDEVSAIWADVPAMIQARMLGIRGQIEFARLRPKQAIEYLEKALQFDLSLQGRIELLLALVPCYRLIDQREKAALVVKEIGMWVLLNSPTPPTLWAAVRTAQAEVALDRGNYVHARKQFVRAEEEYEETGWGLSAAQMQISQAWCLLHENQPAEALRLLDQARTFFNTQNWPLIYLDGLAEIYCQAFLMQRNFDALQAELEQWEQLLNRFAEIDLTVHHAKLWQWRGVLAVDRGQYAEALSAYQRALEFWQQVPFSEIIQRHAKDQIEIIRRKMAETR
jgi:tetratricopeptide (TPR) repeat protein